MSLNYREIDLILNELALCGSRIDKINQPDRFSLFLETYSSKNKQYILVNLTHDSIRINRIEEKPPFPDFPPRFSQLLRSRIKGGIIKSVSQPYGERLIHFSIIRRNEIYNLWIRLWNGNPNIILTDENHIIIDVLFRKANSGEINGKEYNPDFSKWSKKPKKERIIRDFDKNTGLNKHIEEKYDKNNDISFFQAIKEKEIQQISSKSNKIIHHLQTLNQRRDLYQQWEIFKLKGEIIQSNLHQIKRGQTLFESTNYNNHDEPIKIELKRELKPDENCEEYFKKYKKFKQGLLLTDKEIESQTSLLSSLELMKTKINQCADLEELSLLVPQTPIEKKIKEKNQIGLSFHSSGFEILVGRNSKENDQLLRRKVKGKDLWLHVRDNPGGFIFIKSIKGKSIPLDILLDGANLALLYSKKKYKDNADIHYTEVKNLRRVKGGKEGLVLAQNEKNLFIKYDENRIKRLQKKSILDTEELNPDN